MERPSGRAIHHGELEIDALAALRHDPEDEARHAIGAVNDVPGGRDLAAAVGRADRVFGKQRGDRVNVAATGRVGKSLRKVGRRCPICGEAGPLLAQPPRGPARELAAGRGRRLQHIADLGVIVIERLAQNVRRPLARTETLEHQQHRHSHVVGALEVGARVLRNDNNRLGKPRSLIGRALALCGAQAIDAKARAGSHEPGFGRPDVFVDFHPAQIEVLHRVFRVANRAQHAVGEFEETGAGRFESARGVVGVARHGGLGRCRLQATA